MSTTPILLAVGWFLTRIANTVTDILMSDPSINVAAVGRDRFEESRLTVPGKVASTEGSGRARW
jgi:hypothetical protein